MSSNDLERLEDEVGDEITQEQLLNTMEELNGNIERLINIFQEANRLMEADQDESRLEKVMRQNKEIANGIIAVAELIKEQESSSGSPQRHQRSDQQQGGYDPQRINPNYSLAEQRQAAGVNEEEDSEDAPSPEAPPRPEPPSKPGEAQGEDDVPEPPKKGFMSKLKS
jgi:hypothetical protein